LDGVYKGLVFGQPTADLYFDDNSVVVHPEVAQKQIDSQRQQTAQPPTMPSSERLGSPTVTPSTPPTPRLMTRYHGTVTLNPQRANKEMATIVEEIIQHLAGLTGTDVRITLEISAERSSGFDDSTMRTINENSRTLKFKSHGFEGD
jgi:hypothetical protein